MFAQVGAKKTVVRQVDADANSKNSPGDTLRYTITITNTTATNLANIQLGDTIGANQTLVPGSIKSTPTARADSYNAIGNTLLTVAAGPGVLLNDSDPDGDGLSVSAASSTSANGGTVSVAADGSFTYISAAGFTGTDTFGYTISDGNGGTSSSTVTLTVSSRVWYVNNAGANGDGRQTSPFNSLTGAQTASAVNDFIYVFQGSGNYTAGITLKNTQTLVGSGDALVVSGTTIFSAGVRPTLLASSGTGVSLATNNIVHGLNVGSSSGRAFSGAVGNLVISNVIATATGGAAAMLTNGTVDVTLDSASSTGSADNGINLSSINGTFVVNGGSIGTAAGTDFIVAGGNGTITYAGSINNAAGRSADISGRTGGTVTLSGNITDTGTGLIVQNNTGGTTTFSGATKTLNTGANAAVSLTSNNGHTINFSNGGLAVTTTSGIGFNATGGATAVNVTGTSNTISSGIGRALNVASTTIGGSGLTFRSISANGAANGITLTSTGSGGLTVTGDGGGSNNGSGGTISSPTAQGIFVSGSGPISLGYMIIQNSTTHGIQVTNAPGFTLNRCNVTDLAGVATDEGVLLDNVSGTLLFSNDTISGAPHNAVHANNFNVNMTAFIMTNTTVTCPGGVGAVCVTGGTTGNDGLLVEIRGTSVLTSGLISGCTFSGMRAVAAQIQANDTGRIGSNSGGAITAPAAANSFVIQNNVFTGNGQGIDIDSSQVSSVTFQVLNNTINGKVTSPGAIPNQASSNGINAFTAAGADTGPASHTFVGVIDGNSIGTQGVKDSGSGFGSGIRVVVQGQNTQGSVTVNNNTIREVPNSSILNFYGQNGAATTGTGTARFKITNNTMPAPSGSNLGLCGPANTPCAEFGIFVLADEGFPVCTTITGNNIFDLSSVFGGSFDIYLAERVGPPAGAQLTVAGSGVVTTYLNANNTLAGASKSFDEGGNVTTGAACGTFP